MANEAIQYLPVDSIECDPQLRDVSDQSVVGLARSIQEIGLQQPVRVRRDGARMVMLDGERRLRACRLTKARDIPVIVEEKELSEGEILHRQIISAVQKTELSPIERALAIKRLMEATGWQANEAAAKCGLSAPSVCKLLALLSLPQPILRRVGTGEIGLAGAYALCQVADRERQAALATQIVKRQLKGDALTKSIKASRKNRSKRAKRGQRSAKAVLPSGEAVTVTATGLTVDRFIELLQQVLATAERLRGRGVALEDFCRLIREEQLAPSQNEESEHVAVSI
jgi:ParB family transcriptional regulator, chromosome partitioning protein